VSLAYGTFDDDPDLPPEVSMDGVVDGDGAVNEVSGSTLVVRWWTLNHRKP
jgi:hypothetical protein